MIDGAVRAVARMGTVVSVAVPARDGDPAAREDAIERALGWFDSVEAACSRFDPSSELRLLCDRPRETVPVGPILFEAVEFALALAEETSGAFDPTVGAALEARGFDRDYRDGQARPSGMGPTRDADWRDVRLDRARRTIRLERPLLLDLGAVAKGLAVDLAARELAWLGSFSVDAGGDIYLGGRHPSGRPWSIGVRDPRDRDRTIATVRVADAAVCTSGDYERQSPDGSGHHVLDPRTDRSASELASVTVVAPSAMVADGLGTAAFVLGPTAGLALLERQGVDGLLITPSLEQRMTSGMAARLDTGSARAEAYVR